MTLSALALVVLGLLPQGDAPEPAAGSPTLDQTAGTAQIPAPGPVERLMLELLREPRIIGTPGYDRALDLIEDTLQRAGVETKRAFRKSGRAIPLRSDVHFFEDGTQEIAFAGLRERWNPDATPTMPRPMAYDHNPESAHVRGAVIQVGSGLDADFDRVTGLGLSLEGAILLATMELAPGKRTTTVREIADRAAAVGAAGVLIAPALDAKDHGADSPLYFVEENTIHRDPLPVPVAPIRGLEADSITKRLRTRRVRGEDGKAIPLRLGPGPVEVSITVECPLVLLDQVAEIVVPLQPGKTGPTAERMVSVNDLCELPLDGTFELTAEVLALIKGYDAEARAIQRDANPGAGADVLVHIVFGPFAVSERRALLAPMMLPTTLSGGLSTGIQRANLRTSVIPGQYERFDALAAQLGEDLKSRVDAAARFVGYEPQLTNPNGAVPDAGWFEIARRIDEAANVLRRPL